MSTKAYYIKERHNGQSDPYFVAEGQLAKAAAKRKEKTLAGFNVMHSFPTKEAYEAKIAELKSLGEMFI